MMPCQIFSSHDAFFADRCHFAIADFHIDCHYCHYAELPGYTSLAIFRLMITIRFSGYCFIFDAITDYIFIFFAFQILIFSIFIGHYFAISSLLRGFFFIISLLSFHYADYFIAEAFISRFSSIFSPFLRAAISFFHIVFAIDIILPLAIHFRHISSYAMPFSLAFAFSHTLRFRYCH
jgi:hypothetical protein